MFCEGIHGKLLSIREYIMTSYFPNGNFIYLYIRTVCCAVVIRLFKLALQRVRPKRRTRTERWSFHSGTTTGPARMIIGHRSSRSASPGGQKPTLLLYEHTSLWHGLMFNSFVPFRVFKPPFCSAPFFPRRPPHTRPKTSFIHAGKNYRGNLTRFLIIYARTQTSLINLIIHDFEIDQ